MFAVPRERVLRIHASSGTTGKPTVVGYTRNDIDTWANLVARSLCASGARPGMLVHIAVGYGLFTAETGTVLTAAHIGHYLLVRRDKLPIEKFTTHDLRRTVATMLTEMGIALDLVAAVVGHEAGGKETRTLGV